MKIIAHIIFFISAGFLMTIGLQAGKYLIKDPKTTLLVCFSDGDEVVGACKALSELTKESSSNE